MLALIKALVVVVVLLGVGELVRHACCLVHHVLLGVGWRKRMPCVLILLKCCLTELIVGVEAGVLG